MVTIKSMENHLQGEEREVKMRVLVESVSHTQKDGGNRWIDLFVSDSTGKCTFKIWGEQMTDELSALLPRMENNVVECVGLVEMWQGTISLRISAPSLKLAEEGTYDAADFFPSLSKEGREELLQRYKRLLDRLQELGSIYYGLVLYSFTKARLEYMGSLPGGINSHSFRGGLFLHTIETAEMAMANARCYNENLKLLPYGDKVDEGLVIAAALLHDIGKVVTMESIGTGARTSLQGLWVGSSVQSILMVNCINGRLQEKFQIPNISELIHCMEACDSRAEDVPTRNMEAMICRNANALSEQLHAFNHAWHENERKGRGSTIMYSKELSGTIIRRRKEEIG